MCVKQTLYICMASNSLEERDPDVERDLLGGVEVETVPHRPDDLLCPRRSTPRERHHHNIVFLKATKPCYLLRYLSLSFSLFVYPSSSLCLFICLYFLLYL